MLSTNFCNGGDEIYEIKNLEDWSNDLFPYKITKNLCNFINLIWISIINFMTNVRQKKEDVKMHLKDLRKERIY